MLSAGRRVRHTIWLTPTASFALICTHLMLLDAKEAGSLTVAFGLGRPALATSVPRLFAAVFIGSIVIIGIMNLCVPYKKVSSVEVQGTYGADMLSALLMVVAVAYEGVLGLVHLPAHVAAEPGHHINSAATTTSSTSGSKNHLHALGYGS